MNTNKKRLITYIISIPVFLILVALDQFTKVLAVEHLKDQPPVDIIKDVLQLTYVQNTGAAWGLMDGWKIFFIIITSIMLIAIIFIHVITPMNKKYDIIRALLVVLAAGAVGNLIDRVMNGYVHDFIYFKIIDFPVFNVADICVTVSMFTLMILIIFKYKDDDFKFIKDFFSKNKNTEQEITENKITEESTADAE